jgi:hypothetical protein
MEVDDGAERGGADSGAPAGCVAAVVALIPRPMRRTPKSLWWCSRAREASYSPLVVMARRSMISIAGVAQVRCGWFVA